MSSAHILDLNFSDSNKIKVETVGSLKFLLLYFLSLGLYGIWWMYTAWRFFKEKESSDIMPVWRAIFSIFFIYSLFDKILNFAKQNSTGVQGYSSGLLTAAFIILNLCSRLPDPIWLIAFGAAFCFIQPINALNVALKDSDKYEPRDSGMTTGQVIIIIVGSLFWVLILVGLFVPAEPEY